ncbi:MAG: trypsin-like peptidase domain-containing protein [Planctomycetes bacterium]|nr:trypsin-like peptidase domain-containing protein [Planctomycetota bacterium]
MRFVTFLTMVLVTSVSMAETVCVRVVRQDCNGSSCQRITEYGSAVVVSEGKPGEWRAITADHVLEHSARGNTWVAVGGEWRPVFAVYRVDGAGDSAFLGFRYDGQLSTVPTATEDTEVGPGDTIVYDGFAEGRTYQRIGGQIVSSGVAQCKARPAHGQSGGGVYSNGVLIGTVTGFDKAGNLVYEPVGRFRRRCVSVWGYWIATCKPVRPQLKIPSTGSPEVAPPPPPEKPIVALPAVPSTPPGPTAPSVTKEDLKTLTDAIADLKKDLTAVRNTKIPVQVLTADGSVISQDTVNLGDPIKLRLVPKKQ